MSKNLSGVQIQHYQVYNQLGEGGMATIYKAVDTRLDREVAIKLLRTERLESGKALKRFELEARALAQLNHPHIVQVLDYGQYKSIPYLVMEYIDGGSLKDILGTPIPWKKAATLLTPIAEALAYSHQKHIIHRDVKPSNILITQGGKPMLSDFGVAKMLSLEETLDLTGTSVGVGTPWYMAPEQGTSTNVDPRSDIYSLGVVFYEMVTGRKPFQADTPMAVLFKHINDVLPRPRDYNPDLPRPVERVMYKLLKKDPDQRIQNMEEVEDVLLEISQGSMPKVSLGFNLVWFKTWGKWVAVGLSIFLMGFIYLQRDSDIFLGWNQSLETSLQVSLPTTYPSTRTIGLTVMPTESKFTETKSSTITPSIENKLTIGDTKSSNDGMTTVYIPEGEFSMGSLTGDLDEQPFHQVYLDGFWMDEHEVTEAQFMKFVDEWGYSSKNQKNRENVPVTDVDWHAANTYCEWVGKRLPTEAEWEKAARGGLAQKMYPWGDEEPVCQPGEENGAKFFSWGCDEVPLEIKMFSPNGYGLYDMLGSVLEWTADWYDPDYYQISPYQNPAGPTSGLERVVRGEGWSSMIEDLRISNRFAMLPTSEYNDAGFRCVQSVSDADLSGQNQIDRNLILPLKTADPVEEIGSMDYQAGDSVLSDMDGMRTFYIPAGNFPMGSKSAVENEEPEHNVYLDAYWIDEHEVTFSQFQYFLENTSYSADPYGVGGQYPVGNVLWEDANAYCEWAGRRLPTEAEWEKAARGGLPDAMYPWGNENPSCLPDVENGAYFQACQEPFAIGEDPVSVKNYSPNGFGLYDMAGNVSEWVYDVYDPDYYSVSPTNNPTGPSQDPDYQNQHVIRGGSMRNAPLMLRVSARGYSNTRWMHIGFRCARSFSQDDGQ